MKLTVLLITIACLQVSANAFSQINLTKKKAPLIDVLNTIQSQTGYTFFYKAKLIENIKVDANLHNATLQQALDAILAGQPLAYEVIDKTVAIKSKEKPAIEKTKEVSAVPVTVSGRVTDSLNTPLIGATVSIKGNNTVITNDQGEFSIKAEVGDQVIISFIGYKPHLFTIAENTSFQNIILHASSSKLNEVVVSTGYQTLPKERATGSFESVNKTQFNQKVSTSIIDRLEGVSSIRFDKNENRPPVTIRGFSSINGSNVPLIILDNFPYEGDINNINPNDIENVTILKDASAASIWGTRAGNGVIVINTKKGHFNNPLKVEISSNLTVLTKPNLFNSQQISSSDFIDAEKFLYNNGYYANQIADPNQPVLSPVVELLIKETNGQLSQAAGDAQINALRNVDVRNDFNKYLYQIGFNQQHAINLSGGTANSTYNISGGYDNDIDVLNSRYNRATLRAVNSFKPINNLLISTSLSYSASNTTSGKPAYNSIHLNGKGIYPYAQFADASGNSLPLYGNRQTYIDTVGRGKLLDWKYYPLEDYKHSQTKLNLNDILANLNVNYKILKSLSVDLKYQFEKQLSNQNFLQDDQSYYTRDLINQFSQINTTTGNVTNIVPKGSILDRTEQQFQSNNGRVQLNYNNSWSKHEISALAGAEVREAMTDVNSYRSYGYNDNILSIANVDYVNAYTTYISSGQSYIPSNLGVSKFVNRYVSEFANAAYTYNSKYTFSGSVRRDASNLFGVTSNDKWTPLWSIGGSWNISNESFYHSTLFPYLKLRATYGYSGNVDQSRSALTTLKYIGPDVYTNLTYAGIFQFANPSLRWEKVQSYNIGIDFNTKNSVLSGSIEAYGKKGLDLFGPSLVDYTAIPTYNINKNVASMQGYGVDINLNAKIFDKTFKWYSNVIFTYNTNKVTSYYLLNNIGYNYVGNGNVISPVEGQALYSILSFKSASLDNAGNPRGYLNGQLSTDYASILNNTKVSDLVYSGSATPTVYGNFNNTFSWENLSMTTCISYSLGYYFRKPSINYTDLASNWTGNSDFAKRWQKPGDENITTVPSFVYPIDNNRDAFYNYSDVLVRKGDNIRLQYVKLSYDFKSRNSKLPFDNFQLYALVSNLGILWRANKDNIDPDYIQNIAPAKTITFGFKTKF